MRSFMYLMLTLSSLIEKASSNEILMEKKKKQNIMRWSRWFKHALWMNSWIWNGAHYAVLYVIALLTAILLFWCRWIITITTIILDMPLLLSHSEFQSFVLVWELDHAFSLSFFNYLFPSNLGVNKYDDKSKSDKKRR